MKRKFYKAMLDENCRILQLLLISKTFHYLLASRVLTVFVRGWFTALFDQNGTNPKKQRKTRKNKKGWFCSMVLRMLACLHTVYARSVSGES